MRRTLAITVSILLVVLLVLVIWISNHLDSVPRRSGKNPPPAKSEQLQENVLPAAPPR